MNDFVRILNYLISAETSSRQQERNQILEVVDDRLSTLNEAERLAIHDVRECIEARRGSQ